MSTLHRGTGVSEVFMMTLVVIAYLHTQSAAASHTRSNHIPRTSNDNKNNNNENNKHCTEPDDADLEKLYIKMVSSAEFHESLTQVPPLRNEIHKRVFSNPGEDVCDNKTTPASTQEYLSLSSMCRWGTVMFRNEARYPRAVAEVVLDPRGKADRQRRHLCDVSGLNIRHRNHGCQALVLHIRVLRRTQRPDEQGHCVYVPGWHKQTVAYVPTRT